MIILGVGSAAICLALGWDDPVDGELRLHYLNPFYPVADLVSKLGDWPCLLLVGGLLSLWLQLRGHVETSRILLVVLATGICVGFSSSIVRDIAGRTRPNAQTAQGFYGPYHNHHWIAGRYEFGSFPSGHTATIAGGMVAAWRRRRRWAPALAGFVVLVAWSRLAMNCHHLSDVIASVVWAMLVGPFLLRWIDPWIKGWGAWVPALARAANRGNVRA